MPSFTRTLAALLLATLLTACGGGDPEICPDPDVREPTPCAGTQCGMPQEAVK